MTFIGLIPYLLICAGAVMVLHGICDIIMGAVNKKISSVLVSSIVSILIGAITMALGFLTIGSDPVIQKQLMIFGIILLLVAVYDVIACFTSFKASVIIVNAGKKDENKEESKE